MKYKPSNGTEGLVFFEYFCDKCWHDRHQECQIIALSMGYEPSDEEYPDAWTYDEEGSPTCLKFRDKELGEEIIIDPNQLEIFEVEDEH